MNAIAPRPDDPRHALAAPAGQAGRGLAELMSRPLSEADLDRATAELAAPLEARSRARRSLLAFRRGAELFGVPAVDAAKVVPATQVHRVPHRTNAVFRGIANHEGELLLVVSLEAALGLPPHELPERRVLVVLGTGRDRWAFEADMIEGVLDVPANAFRAPPVTVTASRSGCVEALAATTIGEVVVLEPARLHALFRGATA
jgi:chemotaxis signal transduction protein